MGRIAIVGTLLMLACGESGAPIGMSDAPATEACAAQSGAVSETLALSADAAGAADVVVHAGEP